MVSKVSGNEPCQMGTISWNPNAIMSVGLGCGSNRLVRICESLALSKNGNVLPQLNVVVVTEIVLEGISVLCYFG